MAKKKNTMEFRFYEIPQGEAALVLCGESWIRIYGHEEFQLHFHNLMEIGICRNGIGDMYLHDEVHRYEDGVITIIPENYPHVTISDGEDANFWEYIFLDVRSGVEELFPGNPIYQEEVLKSLNKRAVMLKGQENPQMTELINEIIRETKEKKSFYRKKIAMYVKALVLEIMRHDTEISVAEEPAVKGSNMAQIAAALDFINKNYAVQFRAADLAEICNMSETHFRRVFEEYINMSPMDYVNLIRVQKACDLMKKSNDSMDLVASKCGFATTSTFNRNFKKFLNTSPYQWKINPGNYENQLLNFRISALKGW